MARQRLWAMLIYAGAALLVGVSLFVWWQTPTWPLNMAARLAALLGYNALFLAILTAEYVRQVRRLLGVSFMRAHHFLALGGLALIIAHPTVMVLGGKPLPSSCHSWKRRWVPFSMGGESPFTCS